MNREKAIEILQELTYWVNISQQPDTKDALKLAIKDMQYIQNCRRFPHHICELEIPGALQSNSSRVKP